METCDVLVIGHGLAGAAVAYEMQPFANVVLVERAPRDQPPALLPPPTEGTLGARLAAASRPFYTGQANALAGRPVAVPRDVLLIASSDRLARLETAAPAGDRARIEVAEIVRELPFLASESLAGGLLEPDALGLDTNTLQRAWRDAFTARGGRLVPHPGPIAIDGDGAPWRVSAGPARLEASVLVDAAGPFAEEIAEAAGVPPLGLRARRRTTFRFEARDAPPAGMPAIEHLDSGLRLEADGATFVAGVTDLEVFDLAGTDPRAGGDHTARAIGRVEAETQLRVGRVLESTDTLIIEAADGAPVVGHDDFVPGFFWAAGEGPEGMLTPVLARAAASLLVGGVLPEDLIELKIVPEDLLPLRFRDKRDG